MKKTLTTTTLIGVIALTACGANEEPAPSTTSHTPAPISESPLISGFPITQAEDRHDIRIRPVDLGPEIIDGVSSERGVIDRSGWRVAAYCPHMQGRTVIAGVIKEDDFTTITGAGQGASIADNSLHALLDCPTP